MSALPQKSSPATTFPQTLPCKGLLFDMDGILVSSLGSVERSWRAWALARGVDPDLAIRTAHGCRAIETIRKLRPDLDDLVELRWIEDLEVNDQEGVATLPGVRELLAALPADHWTVVTSATERLARVRLAAVGLRVPERIITADQVTHGKPHPEPYLRGAALLGLPPAECVVFEDSGSGAKAGHAAGATVIATLFSHTPSELAAAHFLVRDLTQIALESLADGLVLRLNALRFDSPQSSPEHEISSARAE